MGRLFIFTLVVIILYGCKKDNTSIPTPIPIPVASGSYSFNFDGKSIDLYGHSTSGIVKGCVIIDGGYMYLSGSSSDLKQSLKVYIKMPTETITAGNYTTSNNGNYIEYRSEYANHSSDYYQTNSLNVVSFSIYNLVKSNGITNFSCSFNGNITTPSKIVTVTNGVIQCSIK